jgi:predicted TPR repeat methyltransferase
VKLQLSSGDLTADRRADYAEMLFANGEREAAAEVMLGALELAPQWALGWFRLGEMQEAAGMANAAAEAWRMTLRLDPDDHPGAALKLQLIGQAPASAAPPPAFVEALFDQYAGSFEQSLVGKLDYRVPALLLEGIAAAGRLHFAHAVDLGCGTGLMGERLRPICEVLEGVDLSAAMLKKAEAKGIYDRLTKADLRLLDLPVGAADLVTASDVFMYVGALDDIFAKAAGALGPGGLFAFSVEKHEGPEPFLLRETRRYAHAQGHVRSLLESSGFGIVSLATAAIRRDRGQPVEGLVAVARRP